MQMRRATTSSTTYPDPGPNTPVTVVLLLQHRRRRCHGGSQRPSSQKDLRVMEAC